MNNSNKLLISGSGEGNSDVGTVWGYAVLSGMVAFCVCLLFAFVFRDEHLGRDGITREFGTASYFMLVGGVVAFIISLIVGSNVASRIADTRVSVYQAQVKGNAVDGDISLLKLIFAQMGWDKARLRSIDFSFEQITSIDVEAESITLGASGVKYKIYASNASKIRDVIKKRQLELKEVTAEAAAPPVQPTGQPAGSYASPVTNQPAPPTEIDPLVRRAFMCLEDGEWEKADGFFEQALNTNPENAHAYVGKLCVELRLNCPEDLLAYEPPIDHYSNYKRALQFADKEHKAKLELYALTDKEKKELEIKRQEAEKRAKESGLQEILDKLDYVKERRRQAECSALVSELTELAKAHEVAADLLRELGTPIVSEESPHEYISCALCGCKQKQFRTRCFRCAIDFVKPEGTV